MVCGREKEEEGGRGRREEGRGKRERRVEGQESQITPVYGLWVGEGGGRGKREGEGRKGERGKGDGDFLTVLQRREAEEGEEGVLVLMNEEE
jgi:hypothetical protein